MALIYCEKCGHEISDKASVCPNCGNSTSKSLKKRNRRIWIVALLCLIVILAVAITSVVYKSKKEEEEKILKEYIKNIDSIYSEANKNKESISELNKEYDSATDIDSIISAIEEEFSDYTPKSVESSPTKTIPAQTRKSNPGHKAIRLETQVKTGRCKAKAYDSDDYYVNIRKKASVHSDILQSIDNETDIYVRPGDSGWYHVSLGPNEHSIGFISVKKVSFDSWNVDTYVVTDEEIFINVYPRATTNSTPVKQLSSESTFQGIKASDATTWIGVLEYNSSLGKDVLVGFVEESKVRLQ